MSEVVEVAERPGWDSNATFAGGPEAGVLLWSNERTALGELVGPDASVVGTTTPASWSGGPAAVARCRTGWLAAWHGTDRAPWVARIDDQGVRGTPIRVDDDAYRLTVACDGDRALVAWQTGARGNETLWAAELAGDGLGSRVAVGREDANWLAAAPSSTGWRLGWSVDVVGRLATLEGGRPKLEVVGPGWHVAFTDADAIFTDRRGDARVLGPTPRAVPNTFAVAEAGGRWFGAGTAPDGRLQAGFLEGPRTPVDRLDQYPVGGTVAGRPVFVWVRTGAVVGTSVDPVTGSPGPARILSIAPSSGPAEDSVAIGVGAAGWLAAYRTEGAGCEGLALRRAGPEGWAGPPTPLVPCGAAQIRGIVVAGAPSGWLVAWTEKRDHDYAANRREVKAAIVTPGGPRPTLSAGGATNERLAVAWDGVAWQLQTSTEEDLSTLAVSPDGRVTGPVPRLRLPWEDRPTHGLVCADQRCTTAAVDHRKIAFAPWGGEAAWVEFAWPSELERVVDGKVASWTGQAIDLLAVGREDAFVLFQGDGKEWILRCTTAGCTSVAPRDRRRTSLAWGSGRAWWSEPGPDGVARVVDDRGTVLAPGTEVAIACRETCLAVVAAPDASGISRAAIVRVP